MWALDPWSESARFVPVPDDWHTRWLIPEPIPDDISAFFLRPATHGREARGVWPRKYESPGLGRVTVYVEDEDEPRLLAILQAAERVVLLFSLIGGKR